MRPCEGVIDFVDVSFKYEDKMVLKHINLRIARNETVALVGESGVGKTTLVNLILRFYDVSDGSIMLDGIDIRDVTIDIAPGKHRPRHAGCNPFQRYHPR